MQDKSCCISTVQCEGLSTVQDSRTNGPWRGKFSLPLEEQLKGVLWRESQSAQCATVEQNKLQNAAATVKPDREKSSSNNNNKKTV